MQGDGEVSIMSKKKKKKKLTKKQQNKLRNKQRRQKKGACAACSSCSVYHRSAPKRGAVVVVSPTALYVTRHTSRSTICYVIYYQTKCRPELVSSYQKIELVLTLQL